MREAVIGDAQLCRGQAEAPVLGSKSRRGRDEQIDGIEYFAHFFEPFDHIARGNDRQLLDASFERL